jgi:formylglycine-generating enzyme required for sulfatase activity
MKKICFLLTVLFISLNTSSQNNAGSLATQLVEIKSIDDRNYFICKLAEIKKDQLSATDQQSIEKILLQWYRDEPDPGIHSAIDYLFRHSKKGEVPREINWNLAQELEKIDKQLQKKGNKNGGWFLTPQLHTMAIINDEPEAFFMGSPPNEKYRTDDELLHTVDIPRSFAISTKEVTVAQFQEFLEANPSIKEAARKDAAKFPSIENKKLLVFSPEPDCPQIYVTWYEAAQYCNWLSKKDGIPQSEWCYPPNEMIKSGMTLSKDHLKRKGYRLPTEAEWEDAVRASTSMRYHFGERDSLLSEYAWYSKNPPQKKSDPIDPNDPKHTYPVGQLLPNTYGLFDVYGNVWEWCDSRRLPYTSGRTVDEPTGDILITDSTAMVRRGGSFSYGKDVMRSAHRGATNYFPNQRRDNVGFRIARTLK